MEWIDLPKELQERILEEQERQGNERNWKYFFNDKKCGGFDWALSEEGYLFWEEILRFGNLRYFRSQQKTTEMKAITRKDLLKCYNEFTCDKWRESIRHILTKPENVLASDTTLLPIPDSVMNLLIREGTSAQKEFVKGLGVALNDVTLDEIIKLPAYEEYKRQCLGNSKITIDGIRISIDLPVRNKAWSFAAWKLATEICEKFNYMPTHRTGNDSNKLILEK